MSDQTKRVSVVLQAIAAEIDRLLEAAADERIAWTLILSTDGVAQYISNAKRTDGIEMMEALLARWKSGRADIPAHYNPDLQSSHGLTPLPNGRSVDLGGRGES